MWKIAVDACCIVAGVKIYIYFDIDKKRSIAALLIMLTVTLMNMFELNDYVYLGAVIVMFMYVDYNKIAIVYTSFMGSLLAVILICSLLDIIPNFYGDTARLQGIKVYSLGYVEHNGFMLFFSFWAFAFLFVVKKHRMVAVFLVMAITGALYYFTASLTSMAIIGIGCMLCLLNEGIEKLSPRSFLYSVKQKLLYFLVGMPIYCAMGLAGLVLWFNITLPPYGANTFNSRLMLIDRALEEVGFNLPKSNYERVADTSFNIITGTGALNYYGGETLYGGSFVQNGLMVVILWIALIMAVLYKALKNKHYTIFFAVVALSILGMSEGFHVNVACSIFWIYLFAGTRKGKNKCKR
ncbi:hypothetical protein [Butyrivibrio proteoclasticus]|uniref:hypothetical protein n=1 Tax=Butyrivibrio proteoclasticus TaxID=43305 RepID=UPI0011609993|nr:hypothetical protein [Butyrivibrio proteoclasticus]